MKVSTNFSRVIFIFGLFCVFSPAIVRAGEKSCDASITSFSCPLCGGMSVNDCLECDGFTNTDMLHNACYKRELFSKQNGSPESDETHRYLWNDLVGMLVWFVAAGMATACGVGGGGIYVPLGIILLRFAPKPSSGLSQCSIFGASLGGLILNMMGKHPKTDIRDTPSTTSDDEYEASGGKFYSRPRIDYDMALFLAPMEMAGAVLGVMIQKIMPNWLYLMTAGVILGFTAKKTFKKYMSTSKKEKESRNQAKTDKNVKVSDLKYMTSSESDSNESDSDGAPSDHGPAEPVPVSMEGPNTESNDVEKVDAIEQRRKLLEHDSRQYPGEKLVALIVLWIGLVVITFMKGGKGVESLVGITCQSPWYYILILGQFLWTFGFSAIYGRKLMIQQKARDLCNYPFLEVDVTWNMQKLRFYGGFTFIAGIVAGLIGIGGGMVLGPLMLVMGIHPVVSSATTATMVVLTSSSVAVLFITSGLVPVDYALFFFAICFCGALIGKKYIDGYVKKSGKASLLIFILASIIGLSTIGCFYIALTRLHANEWCFDGMKPFCDKSYGSDGSCPVTRSLEEIFSA